MNYVQIAGRVVVVKIIGVAASTYLQFAAELISTVRANELISTSSILFVFRFYNFNANRLWEFACD